LWRRWAKLASQMGQSQAEEHQLVPVLLAVDPRPSNVMHYFFLFLFPSPSPFLLFFTTFGPTNFLLSVPTFVGQ